MTVRALLMIALSMYALQAAAQATQYALIVSGLGGEVEYEQRFAEQAKALADAARHASQRSEVKLLSGAGATRAAVAQALQGWREAGGADLLVVTLIGHGSYDGEEYRFNVPGPDVTATDLRQWLSAIQARQVVVVATSASGGALQGLQGGNRIVITATKSGTERNATRFAEHWVAALSATEADRDKNEWVTAQEAFDYAVRKVADSFKANAALATEHARLEGKRADTVPLGRLGALTEMPSDPALTDLFADRVRIEADFEAVKARKTALAEDAYYAELEQTLLALAKNQRSIDARQAALLKETKR